ncbi:peptidoglycan DD-metalloendopeptidase family protein [Streptomyces polyrhachis]|uniref:Peptidoglycan DD-metalloendopeptidase family protein n=1 Tax=Streptomyces polyrhachis TaxID=1282885 RepID=A0ABW2G9M5_9ACTN
MPEAPQPPGPADSAARGRHRRPRSSPVARASLTVTAGGAGLALPLLAAPNVLAAQGSSSPMPREVRHGAPHPRSAEAGVLPQGVRLTVVPASPGSAPGRRVTHYTVRPGDTLHGIAVAHRVRGGWSALYERNRQVIGADPDLIMPGQRLTLHGPRTPEPAPHSKPPAPHPKPAGGAETAEDSGKKPQTTTGYVAPLAAAGVGTAYGVRGSAWSSGYHTGADFPVPVGTGVRAVTGGTVVTAGWGGAYGYQVVVRHTDGRYSQYAHLSAVAVRPGQRVNAGQRVGRSGSTGNTTGPHLHFEIRTGPRYGSDIDPLRYLRARGVRI